MPPLPSPGKKTGTVPKQRKISNRTGTLHHNRIPDVAPGMHGSVPIESQRLIESQRPEPHFECVPDNSQSSDTRSSQDWTHEVDGRDSNLAGYSQTQLATQPTLQGVNARSKFCVCDVAINKYGPRRNMVTSTPGKGNLSGVGQTMSSNGPVGEGATFRVSKNTLIEKETNKGTNVVSMDGCSNSSMHDCDNYQEIIGGRLERQANIDRDLQDFLERSRMNYGDASEESDATYTVGHGRVTTDVGNNDPSGSEDGGLTEASQTPNATKPNQEVFGEIKGNNTYYNDEANEWNEDDILTNEQENQEPCASPTLVEEGGSHPNTIPFPTRNGGLSEDSEVNKCHQNRHKKPDNIDLSLYFHRDDMSMLQNCQKDLLRNEGIHLARRSLLSSSASGDRGKQDGVDVPGMVDSVQTGEALLQTRQQQNCDLEGESRPSASVDRHVAQVDLEHKKKIVEELMKKDQGPISAANQDKKTQDKADAPRNHPTCVAEHNPRLQNARARIVEDSTLGDIRTSNRSQIEPAPWSSSINRAMEWLRDGAAACAGSEATNSPQLRVDCNNQRIHPANQQRNSPRNSCDDNLRNLNVIPPETSLNIQPPQSPATRYSPLNLPNSCSEDVGTINLLQRQIQRLERQLQNAMIKDDVAQFLPSSTPNFAASNVGQIVPPMITPISVPHPGTDNFYQQMLAASQLQQSQLLAMSVSYCQHTLWQQQRELTRLRETLSSLQTSNHENYSSTVPLGQGVVFTSETTIPQHVQESSPNNLARNSSNPNPTFARPLKTPHVTGTQVASDMHSNGGMSNAQSLPNLFPNIYPPQSPVQSGSHAFTQQHTSLRLNNGSSYRGYPSPANNRFPSQQMRFIDAYLSHIMPTAEPIPNQPFPPYPYSIQNSSNFNLTTPSPMIESGAWGGNRVPGITTALNNQVPPGNRANNYWDNFRSYSRQNLLSANRKTNELSSTQPVYPDRAVNTVHNTTQTQSTQTQLPRSQGRPAQAKTRASRTQASFSSNNKRNLNMQEPGVMVSNEDGNKFSPNTLRGANHSQHHKMLDCHQPEESYCDNYSFINRQNDVGTNVELESVSGARRRASMVVVSRSNQPQSDSSEENTDHTVMQSSSRNCPFRGLNVGSIERVMADNTSYSVEGQFQLLPDSSEVDERLAVRTHLLNQSIENLRKQFGKQSNRKINRKTEDPPPSYETISNSVPARQEQGVHRDDIHSQLWQRVPDSSGDNMAALSYVAEYFGRNDQSVIDATRIEDLVYTVHEKMLHLCNHPHSKWETQHVQNFLATLKQELIFFMGKKCADVANKIISNLKSNLFGCYEFCQPIQSQCPDISLQAVPCTANSNSLWDAESISSGGISVNNYSSDAHHQMLSYYLQGCGTAAGERETHNSRESGEGQFVENCQQTNNSDRDLAEADQSHSDPYWPVPGELPHIYNGRLLQSSLPGTQAPRSLAETDDDYTFCNTTNLRTTPEALETPVRSQHDVNIHGIIGDLDEVPIRLSDSRQQLLDQLNGPNTSSNIFHGSTHNPTGDDHPDTE